MRTVTLVDAGTPSTTSRCAPVAPGCGRDVIALPPGNVNSSQVGVGGARLRPRHHQDGARIRVHGDGHAGDEVVAGARAARARRARSAGASGRARGARPPGGGAASCRRVRAAPAAPAAPPRPPGPPRRPRLRPRRSCPPPRPRRPSSWLPAAPAGAPLPPPAIRRLRSSYCRRARRAAARRACASRRCAAFRQTAAQEGRGRPIANEPEPNRRWSLISMVNVRATPTSWPSTEIKSAAKLRAYGAG